LLNLLCRIATASGSTPDEAFGAYEAYELTDENEQPRDEAAKRADTLGIALPYEGDAMILRLKRKSQDAISCVPDEVLEMFPYISKHDTELLEWLMIERRISIDAIIAFRLRKFQQNGKLGVIFPVLARENKKRVLDMFVRLIDGKQNFRLTAEVVRRLRPRLHNIPDYKAPHLCFGNHLHDATKAVVIVEAPLDAMRLYSLNFKNVLATCGALGRKQAELLYSRTVYLGFDADDAGRKFMRRAFRLLKPKVPVIYRLDWSKASERRQVKDANELKDVSEARHIFHEKTQLQGLWPNSGGFGR